MKKQSFQVDIKGYSKKGSGTATIEKNDKEQTIEVKGALLHEEVIACAFKKRKKKYVADLIEVIKPSPFRIKPKCQDASECGGCSWQHSKYAHQLESKQQVIAKLFSPYFPEDKIAPILAAQKLFEYRNKMEYSFSQDLEGNRYLGLIKSNSKGKVLNIEHCQLVRSWQSDLLKAVREYWKNSKLNAYHPFKDEGTFQTLILREGLHTHQKLVMLTVSSRADAGMSKSQIENFKQVVIDQLGEDNISIYLRVRQAVKGSPTQFFEMHLHGLEQIKEKLIVPYEDQTFTLEFVVSPSSFFQPNSSQAQMLFSKALELAPKKKNMKVLDLYCGTGTLSIVFAKIAQSVIAIEINPYSIFDAKENAKINNISNVNFLKGDAKEVLKDLRKQDKLEDIDLVVLDPPRAGLDEKALGEVLKIFPEYILYISCHPHSQVEDVSKFINNGYTIEAIQPVDQFPHTPHIENIVLLKR